MANNSQKVVTICPQKIIAYGRPYVHFVVNMYFCNVGKRYRQIRKYNIGVYMYLSSGILASWIEFFPFQIVRNL